MKFIVATQELALLLNKCLSIISTKVTAPILSNLLIEAKDGLLTMIAIDLVIGIQCQMEAKVIESGSTTLPAKKFASLIRELTAANVEISTNDQEIAFIAANSSRFKLHGMSPKEFPSLPDLDNGDAIKIKQHDLKEMLQATLFSISRNNERYELTGLSLEIFKGQMTCIATDGRRLAKTQSAVEGNLSLQKSCIIPSKAVEEMVKNLGVEEEAILYLMSDKIALKTDCCTLITKLLNGNYPDVKQVIPEKTEISLSLHREELATLLRQISLFAPEGDSSVKFSFSNGELKLASNSRGVGEGQVSMPVNYHGPQLDIAFNPHLMLDILRHSKSEALTLGLTDSYNPGIVTEQQKSTAQLKEASPLFVLMPMRLN